MVGAAGTRHKLCGDVGGNGGAPREVTRENEPLFITILCHVHLQQPYRCIYFEFDSKVGLYRTYQTV